MTSQRTAAEFIPASQFITFNERYSDVGNAKWFIRLYGEQVRWIPERGKWITKPGVHWAEDTDGEVERMAKNAVAAIWSNLRDLPLDAREALFKHLLKSEQAPRIAAMLSLAKSEQGITLAESQLDRDPMLLGVQGGAINLRTSEFTFPRSADYIVKQTGCEFNPHAKAPIWCAFLDKVMDGDLAMIAFLQRAVGYCLTGNTSEQCLFIAYGNGANGKSVFLRTLRELLGDYGRYCPTETLLVKRNDGVSNDIARLAGARLVCAVETEDGKRLAESLVKTLTGSEQIAARFLFREYFEFVPAFKVWIATNHKPAIRGNDDAIWRRIRLIPFNITIPEGEQDRELLEKLRRELSGILNWALEGCRAWQEDGLQTPEPVRAATADYRSDMDRLGTWITERCIVTPAAKVQASFAYQDYRKWAEDRGEQPLTLTTFGNQLTERGIQKLKGRTVIYLGIGLCDSSATVAGEKRDVSSNTYTRDDLPQKSRGVSSVAADPSNDDKIDTETNTHYGGESRGE